MSSTTSFELSLPAPLIDPASVETPPPVRARIKEMQKQMEQMYGAKRSLENQLCAATQALQSLQTAQSTLTLALHKSQKERKVQEARWEIERKELGELQSTTAQLTQDKISLVVARHAVREAGWAKVKEALESTVAKSMHDAVKLQSTVDDLRLKLKGEEQDYGSLRTAYDQTRKSFSALQTAHARLQAKHTTSLSSLSTSTNGELTILRSKLDKAALEASKLRAEVKLEKEGKEKAEKEGRIWKEEKEEKERELKGWVREEKGKGTDTEKQLRILQSELRSLKADLESKREEVEENAAELSRLRKEARVVARLKDEVERLKADKQETEDVCEKLAAKLRKLKSASTIAENVSPVRRPVALKIKEKKESVVSATAAAMEVEENEEILEGESESVVPKAMTVTSTKRKVDAVSEGETSKKAVSKKSKSAAEEPSRSKTKQRAATPASIADSASESGSSDGYVPQKKGAAVKSARPRSEPGAAKSTKSTKPLGSTTAQNGESAASRQTSSKESEKFSAGPALEKSDRKRDSAAVAEAKPKKTMRKLGNPLNVLGGGSSFLSLMLDNPNGTIPGVMSPAPAPGRLVVNPNVKRFNAGAGGLSRF